MGLDIYFSVKNEAKYFAEAEKKNIELSDFGLSRTFYYFFSDYNLEDPKSDLSILGKIAKVDITPLIKMTWYCDELDMKSQLGIYEEEDEKQKFITNVQKRNQEVIGNINIVNETVKKLISNLGKESESLIQRYLHEKESLNELEYFEYYLSNINENIGKSTRENNLGQDLRNLKSKIEFAKLINEDTVYFRFN